MSSVKMNSIRWRVEHEGIASALRRITSIFIRFLDLPLQRRNRTVRGPTEVESLHLKPGESVEIKSKDEILATLDGNGRNRGLGIMPEMWAFCGKRARVLKRVTSIVVETPDGTNIHDVRKMKNTVLLEGMICDGARLHCDRACFFFWRECWLRRVPDGTPTSIQAVPREVHVPPLRKHDQ